MEYQWGYVEGIFQVDETLVTHDAAMTAARAIAERVPRAWFIEKPEDLLKPKPVKKKK